MSTLLHASSYHWSFLLLFFIFFLWLLVLLSETDFGIVSRRAFLERFTLSLCCLKVLAKLGHWRASGCGTLPSWNSQHRVPQQRTELGRGGSPFSTGSAALEAPEFLTWKEQSVQVPLLVLFAVRFLGGKGRTTKIKQRLGEKNLLYRTWTWELREGGAVMWQGTAVPAHGLSSLWYSCFAVCTAPANRKVKMWTLAM